MGEIGDPQLTYIVNNSGDNEIDDNGVQFLHKFSGLKVLRLPSNKITGKGASILGEGEFP